MGRVCHLDFLSFFVIENLWDYCKFYRTGAVLGPTLKYWLEHDEILKEKRDKGEGYA